jgi:arylsulfatase
LKIAFQRKQYIEMKKSVAIYLLFAVIAVTSAMGAERMNVILILTDDQGYGDLARHGNPVLRTPHLDRLHDESVRFRQFQVSPTCAPTRSALMTGRHEFKNGVTHTIYERERMTLDAVTLPEALASGGYATGIFGKWHLGDEDAYQPDRRGFQEVFIHGGGGIGQSFPGSCGDVPSNSYFNPIIKHNGTFVQTTGFCTDVFFDQASRWIEAQAARGPFFAYIALNAPHEPYQCPPEYEAPYAGRVPEKTAKFFGMIANIDDNVGRLMALLKRLEIDEETLVVYMTDNGGTAGRGVFNAGLRGGKTTAWQGGVRAISLWRCPSRFAPATVDALTAHLDVMPTLLELAQVEPDARVRAQVEGRSLVPLLRDPAASWSDRMLVTHAGRWNPGESPKPYGACSIRNTRHSLVRVGDAWHLFDLVADPGESTNIAPLHPEIVEPLATAYDGWWADVRPMMINEDAHRTAPAENPFAVNYRNQLKRNATSR